MFTLEICLDSVESAIIAQEAGADRVELCANLSEGGTTPSYGMIRLIREKIDIDLSVMIRPRGGDFCYSDAEFSVMKEDIKIAKEIGADCVVFGILLANGDVDIERTTELCNLAKPMSITFHRAFDLTREPYQALEDIIKSGVSRLLTSGHKTKAIEGKHEIKKLVMQAKNRIAIMAGSGVNPQNRDEFLNYCGVQELHLTAKTYIEGDMIYRPENISMNSYNITSEYQKVIADYQIITKMKSF